MAGAIEYSLVFARRGTPPRVLCSFKRIEVGSAYQKNLDGTSQVGAGSSVKYTSVSEWEAVRARNGWVNIHNSGDDFVTFLEQQEKVIKGLMTKLGFL